MKTRFLLGQMIDYLPGQLKDAIHHASKEAGQDTDKLELHRRGHSEKAQTNQIDPTFRKSLKYVSARTQDRDDEIVVPNGIELADFMKYGAVLVNHNYSLMPIGSDEKIWADDFGIKALTVHADTGEGTLANVVWHLVSQGHMKASSIGFVPVETTKPGRRDWDAVANKLQREWPEFSKAAAEKSVSRIITKGVLLEHSFVSVPCNVDAEVEQIIKGMGIRDETVFKGLGWKAEERDGILVPKREVIVIETPDGKVSEKGGSGSGNFGHSGRPGQVGGSGDDGVGKDDIQRGGAGGKRTNRMEVSFQQKYIEERLEEEARKNRDSGSQTYTSMLMVSPNMGNRHYVDISNRSKKIELEQAAALQKTLDFIATEIRNQHSEVQTYVSQETSPNMGTRVFMDVDWSKYLRSEEKSFEQSPDEKSMDLTCSRKLASLRKRMGEEGQDQLDALEKEMEGLDEDDAEGWKTLNGKLNGLLAGLKKGADEREVVEEKKEEQPTEKKVERIIKVVQPPPTIKVLFAPLDPQELAEVAGAAAEKAISRRLGRLG